MDSINESLNTTLKTTPTECDAFFRQLPVRFLGYGMAVGESLTYIAAPELVDFCRTVAQCFAGCHVICTLRAETVDWHTVASVVVFEVVTMVTPAILVFYVTRPMWLLWRSVGEPPVLTTLTPCLLGLALCVVVCEPLDKMADQLTEMLTSRLRRL